MLLTAFDRRPLGLWQPDRTAIPLYRQGPRQLMESPGAPRTRLVTLLPIIEPGLSPELPGDLNGIDAGRLPPGLLVAGAMDGAVMRAAERDGEFIARFAAERPRLQVAKMMRIGLFAAADETRLLGNIAQVLWVTIAPRRSDREDALVDALRLTSVSTFGGHLGPANLRDWRIVVQECNPVG